ncbi:MAG: ABC transporter ATP-binding protein [Tissierellaceae bacterium]
MLEIRNFSKSYKQGKKAVDNISLKVEAGHIYGFIGHNGAGKTTTIKAIAGILDFQEGEILIDGVSIKDDPIGCKRKIAYIPDNPNLYESLTGIQYLSFIADIFGIEEGEREALIKKYGDLLELTRYLGDLISSYSRGMKQKLVIISALIHKPKLLVLDEPFVGLDPRASHALKQVMKELCKEGSAIFFSTHVLEVAEKFCDRIAIIKQGRIAAEGITSEIIGDSSLEDLFMDLTEND